MRESLMNEILHEDGLALTSESTRNLREKFLKWKTALEGKELKINKKIKVMVGKFKEKMLKSKVDKNSRLLIAGVDVCTTVVQKGFFFRSAITPSNYEIALKNVTKKFRRLYSSTLSLDFFSFFIFGKSPTFFSFFELLADFFCFS